jgi:hypothetical protein
MTSIFRTLSLVFAAGCVGAVANSLLVWLFGDLGIHAALGVKIAPRLTPAWLYPRIVWGGLWGFLFLLPIFRSSLWARGFLFSLGPSLVMFLVIFPIQAKKGMLGLDLGTMTPVLVLFYNAVWGVVTAIWLKFSK